MAYEVRLTPAAQRELKAFEAPIQRQLLKRLASLAKNPRPKGLEKLSGGEGLYKIRSGNYRIIYTIHDRELLVVVVRIGDRKEVYRNLLSLLGHS